MKKIGTILSGSTITIFLLMGTTLHAQWTAGALGGISIPNLSAGGSNNNPLNTGYSSRLGATAGLTGNYRLSPLFSLSARLEYLAEGGKKNGMQALTTPEEIVGYYEGQGLNPPTYLYANYKSTAKLNYLMIPILANFGWRLGDKSPFRFYAEAGPSLGYLLQAKQVTSGNSQLYTDPAGANALPFGTVSFDSTTNIRDQLHRFNLGIEGDIGLSYAFGHTARSSVFIQAGGNYGFINIQKGTANGKNNAGAAMATIGYTYGFGRKKNTGR